MIYISETFLLKWDQKCHQGNKRRQRSRSTSDAKGGLKCVMSGNVAPVGRFLLASGIASDMSRTATPEMARLSLSLFIPAEEEGESVMVRDIAMGTFTTIAALLMQVVRLLE
jgi:hypothetical protein